VEKERVFASQLGEVILGKTPELIFDKIYKSSDKTEYPLTTKQT
jgi:hypothetical protein